MVAQADNKGRLREATQKASLNRCRCRIRGMQRVIGFRRQLLTRQYKRLPVPTTSDAPQSGIAEIEVEARGI